MVNKDFCDLDGKELNTGDLTVNLVTVTVNLKSGGTRSFDVCQSDVLTNTIELLLQRLAKKTEEQSRDKQFKTNDVIHISVGTFKNSRYEQ